MENVHLASHVAWTRQTSLKFPAVGKRTVKDCPFTCGPPFTHDEPSKSESSSVAPGHPTVNGGRASPETRNVTVCVSSVSTFHVTLSPA